MPEGKNQNDVFKVFLKDDTKTTLTLNEDIRRVARAYGIFSTKDVGVPVVPLIDKDVHPLPISQPVLPQLIIPIKKPRIRQPKSQPTQSPIIAPISVVPIDVIASNPTKIDTNVEEKDTLKEIADSIEIEIKRELKDFNEEFSE
jgi:hypothetical protein